MAPFAQATPSMLRRFSDVALGSLEKLLQNINGKSTQPLPFEKKRKIFNKDGGSDDHLTEKENYNNPHLYSSKLRKSKGKWDLNSETEPETETEMSSDSIIVDLTGEISDFDDEIPSDLSINEEEFWSKDEEFVYNSESYDHDHSSTYYNHLLIRESRLMKCVDVLGHFNSNNLLLSKHPDLNFVMRAKLISWIFEVALHFKLQRETVHSTQSLLDSYLYHPRVTNIPRTKLQLIGLACLLISSKIEEIRPPNLADLRSICDNLYTKKEIAEMELDICMTLQWNLTPMNLLTWTRYYCNLDDVEGSLEESSSLDHNSDIHNVNHCNISSMSNTINSVLDYLIHFPDILNFKPSKLSLAIISFFNSSPTNFDSFIQEETDWLTRNFSDTTTVNSTEKPLPFAIAYCDPKQIDDLSNEFFEKLMKEHRKTLNSIIKRIKQGV